MLLVAVVSFAAGAVFSNYHLWGFVLFPFKAHSLLRHDPRLSYSSEQARKLPVLPRPSPPAVTQPAATSSASSVIVILRGSIPQRLLMLCAAEAFMSARGVPVLAIWIPDEGVLQSEFQDLMALPRGTTIRVLETWPSEIAPFNLRNFYVKVRLGLNRTQPSQPPKQQEDASEDGSEDADAAAAEVEASRTASEDDSSFMALPFFVPRDLMPAGNSAGQNGRGSSSIDSVDSMETMESSTSDIVKLPEPQELSNDEALEILSSLTGKPPALQPAGTVAGCVRSLRPSNTVRAILAEETGEAFRSIGVLAERKKPGTECPGCPGRLSLCTIRTIAMEYLKDTSLHLVIASEDPRDALNVSRTFHPTRAPALSGASQMRLKRGCQLMHQLATAAAKGAKGGGKDALDLGVLDEQSDEENSSPLAPLCAQLYLADLLHLGTTRGLIYTVANTPAVNFVLARLPMTYTAISENLGLSPPSMKLPKGEGSQEDSSTEEGQEKEGEEEQGTEGEEGASGRRNPVPDSLKRLLDRRLLSTSGGGASEAGAGEGASEAGASEDDSGEEVLREVLPGHCVCTSPEVHQLADHAHAPNTIIDRELKIVYCAVEKVASTSLKMLIRSMRRLPGLDNYFRTHTRQLSGLKYLWPHYRGWGKNPSLEFLGIREMTRRDYLKFVFVRNPYTRILSAYLDKEFMGDSRNGQENPKGRIEYNKKFFGKTFAEFYGKPGKKGLEVPWSNKLSFHDFVNITIARTSRVAKMDHHLANQTDLCRLDSFKYDFVGHLETLEDDVDRLLRVLTKHTGRNATKHKGVFPKGQRFHNMKTDQKLLLHYEPDIVNLVTGLYQPDFNNSLNRIGYKMPEVLQTMLRVGKQKAVESNEIKSTEGNPEER